jgi:hypothetical protein
MPLVDDLLRASQAQVAAERIVSLSRAYVLTHERTLFARAYATQAELQHTLRDLEQRASALGEGPLFDSVLVSADRYGEALQQFLDDGTSLPRDWADAGGQRVVPARDRLQDSLDELIGRRQRQIAEIQAATADLAARVVPVMFGICALGFLVGLFVARSALQTIDEAATVVEQTPRPSWEMEDPASDVPAARPPAKIIDFKSIQILPEGGSVLPFSPPTDDGAERR